MTRHPRVDAWLCHILAILLLTATTACTPNDTPPDEATQTDIEEASSDTTVAAGSEASTTAPPASARYVTLNLDPNIVQGAYTMPIQIGTPAKTYNIEVDTGSSNLILLGPPSLCDNCDQDITQKPYDPSQSSSAQLAEAGFSIEYGSGALHARYVEDQVAVGNLPALDYKFGVMTHDQNIGSILGLAYRSVAQPQDNPPATYFETLVATTGIANRFALLLCAEGTSTITLGDDGNTVEQAVPITEERWYVISPNELRIAPGTHTTGSTTSLGRPSVPTVVDSGTTDLELPSDMYRNVMDALNEVAHAHDVSLSGELLSIPDDVIPRFPTLQVLINDVDGQSITLDIAPTTYFEKVSTVGYLLRLTQRDEQLILGQAFMKNYLVVFDRANRRIGLGANTGCSG